MKMAASIGGGACMIAASVFAMDTAFGYKTLTGSYVIASENLVDPAPAEKKDRAVFFLDGDAAMGMYKRMPGVARKDS